MLPHSVLRPLRLREVKHLPQHHPSEMVVRQEPRKHREEVGEECSGLALPQTSCGILDNLISSFRLPLCQVEDRSDTFQSLLQS